MLWSRPLRSVTMQVMMDVYRCPNMKGEGYTVNTNNPPTGSMRCVGHPQGTFAQEVHMDAIAQKLGMDPVELRLKNYARLEDGNQFKKIPFTSNGMEECIKRGAETFGWKEKMQDGLAVGADQKRFWRSGSCVRPWRHDAGNAAFRHGENQRRWHGQRVYRRNRARRRAERRRCP